MRDERGRSEVYDLREEKSAMDACLHYPRRGVNKYMQNWGRLDGGGEKMSRGFVHGVAGSYTNYRELWGKRRGWKSECAVLLKVHL